MVNTRANPAPEYFLKRDAAFQLLTNYSDADDSRAIGRFYNSLRRVIRHHPPLTYVSVPSHPPDFTVVEVCSKIFHMIELIYSVVEQIPWDEPPPTVSVDESRMESVADMISDDSEDEVDDVFEASIRSGISNANQTVAVGDAESSGTGRQLSIVADSAEGTGLSGPPPTMRSNRRRVRQPLSGISSVDKSSSMPRDEAHSVLRSGLVSDGTVNGLPRPGLVHDGNSSSPRPGLVDDGAAKTPRSGLVYDGDSVLRSGLVSEGTVNGVPRSGLVYDGTSSSLRPGLVDDGAAKSPRPGLVYDGASGSLPRSGLVNDGTAKGSQRSGLVSDTPPRQTTFATGSSQQNAGGVTQPDVPLRRLPQVQFASSTRYDANVYHDNPTRFSPSPIRQTEGASQNNMLDALNYTIERLTLQQQHSTRVNAESILAGSGFEQFDAGRSVDFKSWLFGLENRLRLTKTTDDAVKVGHLVNCLAGLARRQFHEDLENPTYETAIQYLKSKYTDNRYNALKYQQFRSKMQRRGESIQSFARELRLAYPFPDQRDTQQYNLMLMEQLQRGVSEAEHKVYIQEHLLSPKKTFEDVVQKLAVKELAKETADVKGKPERVDRQRRFDNDRQHYCVRCQRKTDHIGDQCPFQRPTQNAQQPYHYRQQPTYNQPGQHNPARNFNNKPLECFKCGGAGHYASTCRNPPSSRRNLQSDNNVRRSYTIRGAIPGIYHPNNRRSSQQQFVQPQYEYQHQGDVPPASQDVRAIMPGSTVQSSSEQINETVAPTNQEEEVRRVHIVRMAPHAIKTVRRNMNVKVQGVEIPSKRVLPDTGAEIDMTTVSFLKVLGYEKDLTPCHHPLMGICNTEIPPCQGTCQLNVTIGSQTKVVTFHVLENENVTDVIIGQPGLKAFGFHLKNDEGIELTPPAPNYKIASTELAPQRVARVRIPLPVNEQDEECLFVFGDHQGTPTAGALLPLTYDDDFEEKHETDLVCELKSDSEAAEIDTKDVENFKVSDAFGEKARIDTLKILVQTKEAFSSSYNVGKCQNTENLGCIPNVVHRIDTGSAAPFKMMERRLPLAHRDMVEKMVNDLLQQGVITESSSNYASCIVLVKKKEGSWRFCVDYRQLNAITKRDNFPLPRIEDLLDVMGDARVFSCLDVKAGYYHIRVAEEDQEKTAFCCLGRLFQFLRLPFGLRNSPATFCRTMTSILQPFISKFVGIYIDDIVVFSPSVEEHQQHLKLVLETTTANGIRLNVNKCQFLQSEVKYLGSIVSAGTIKVDPKKSEAVKRFPLPLVKRRMQEFVGMVSFHRRHHENLSTRLAPFQKLIRDLPYPNSKLEWTEELKVRFENLKETLGSPPYLSMPVVGQPYLVTSDASAIGFGGVLQQNIEEKIKTIAYASRKTSDTESRYSATELELRGLVFAVQSFRAYLLGTEAVCRTDHRALIGLLKAKEPSARLFRWSIILQEFNLRVEYQPGKQNVIADALSRSPIVAVIRLSAVDKQSLLEQHHSTGLSASHAGVHAMMHRLKRRYQDVWPSLNQDVREHVAACNVCSKRNTRYERLPLSPRPPPEQPRQVWYIDYTEIRKSSRYPYALVMVDGLSRWMLAVYTNSQNALTTIKGLQKIMLMFGCPLEICSDNGRHFTAKIVQEYLETHGIKHSLCTPYSKTSMGIVERANRTLQTILAKKIEEKTLNRNQWYTILDETLLSYNTSPHKSLGYRSPYEVVYGTHYNSNTIEFDSKPALQALWNEVRKDIEKSQQINVKTTTYDRLKTKFAVGNNVFVKRPTDMAQRMLKIDLPNSEEAVILSLGRKSAEIRQTTGGKTHRVPLNWLQPRH